MCRTRTCDFVFRGDAHATLAALSRFGAISRSARAVLLATTSAELVRAAAKGRKLVPVGVSEAFTRRMRFDPVTSPMSAVFRANLREGRARLGDQPVQGGSLARTRTVARHVRRGVESTHESPTRIRQAVQRRRMHASLQGSCGGLTSLSPSPAGTGQTSPGVARLVRAGRPYVSAMQHPSA